jgi:transcriptional regulator with XRE-family HTH domain
VGDRIRKLRLKHRLSQADLARQTHMSGSYVSLIESGRRPPTERALRLVADRLGTSIEYLQTGRGGAVSQHDALEVAIEFAELTLRAGDACEARTRFAEAEALAMAEPDPAEDQLWRARWGLARAHEYCGELEEAIGRYEILLRADAHTDDFVVQTALCRAYMEAGDLSHAVDIGEAALSRARDDQEMLVSDAAVELASTLVGCYQERGDLMRAHLLAAQVTEDADRARSPRARGAAYWNAALVAEARGDLKTAKRYLDRAVALYGEGDNERGVALLRVAQGWVALQEDEPDVLGTLQILERAYAELPRVGTPVDVAYAETELARCALAAGRLTDAVELSERALDRLGPQPRLEASRVRVVLAQALTGLGNRDAEVLDALTQAAEGLERAGSSREAAGVWRELAEALVALGRTADAVNAFRKAIDAADVGQRHRARTRLTSDNSAGARG